MNDRQFACDPERIELFLQQKLSDAEQTAFELHLDDCNGCRQRLEATAAGEDVWTGVRESLRDAQHPPDCLRSGDSDSTGEEAFSSQATVLKLLAPTDDDRMIGRWGTYEVVGVVGTGGMGVVLKAFDAALNRYVAIKVLAPHLCSSGAARRRFSREAQAAAAVVHDNVIEIYGVADTAGLPYLVMPYVRGPSLQRRLDDEGPLALAEILRVGMQAAAGLAAAHAQGLVHRDVKPANILLADGIERVKLTDFGLARAADDASLTKTGVIAGTPQYMSPEQARGEPVDQQSDLFSLGSVLYAMCTGRAPFRAETSYGVLRRITDEEPRPIREINQEIPEWLCGVVAKMMAKQPENRFQSAEEVAKLMEQCLAHVQQPTAVPLPLYSPLPPAVFSRMGEGQGVRAHKLRPFSARSRTKRILAAVVGLVFFGGLGLAFGILIHLKRDNKTTTVDVPEGSTAHVDTQGTVTLELPSSPAKPDEHADEKAIAIAAQRIATLEAFVREVERNYRNGNAKFGDLCDAQDQLLNAQLETAKSRSERVAIREKILQKQWELEKMAKAWLESGTEGSHADFLRAQVERQKAELRLAEEKAWTDEAKTNAKVPFSTTPVSVFARGDEAAQRNMEKALRQPVSLEFDNKKLSDVVEYLKESMNKKGCPIEIQLDMRALKKAGIGPDRKITKTIRGASLGTALRLMLNDLQLTFALGNGVLLITSAEQDEEGISGDKCLEIKLYPVTDLVIADPDGEVSAEPLQDILLSAVAEKSWTDNGGNGTMAAMIVNDRLLFVVSQTHEVHEALEKSLTSLRKAAGLKTAAHDALAGASPAAKQVPAAVKEGGLYAGAGGGKAAAPAKRDAARSDAAQAVPAVPDEETAERTIREALDQPVSLRVTKMKLKDAVDYVKSYLDSKGYHVEIQLDLPALGDSGIDPDQQVVPKSVAGISLRSALTLLLDDMELRYVIHNGMLVITTPSAAESEKYQETRFYRVWDLIVNGDGRADFGPLTEFLTGAAEPKSWIDNGGNGSISYAPAFGLLVVSQSEQEHEAVEDYLDALRRAAGLKGEPPARRLPHIHFRRPKPFPPNDRHAGPKEKRG